MPIENDAGQLRAGEPELFRQTANPFPAFSPDGRWLAYASSESGIYPMWSRTRNELFYRPEDQRLMVTTYTVTGDSFVASRPRSGPNGRSSISV